MPAHRRHGRLISRGAPLVALAILAFVLAFHGLATKSLDLDEAVSVEHARLGASGLWSVVAGGDPNMGLYYVLLDGWVRVFGDSETAVRSLTAVSAGLAVPVVALLGIRLFGRVAGLVAGLLLALDASMSSTPNRHPPTGWWSCSWRSRRTSSSTLPRSFSSRSR